MLQVEYFLLIFLSVHYSSVVKCICWGLNFIYYICHFIISTWVVLYISSYLTKFSFFNLFQRILITMKNIWKLYLSSTSVLYVGLSHLFFFQLFRHLILIPVTTAYVWLNSGYSMWQTAEAIHNVIAPREDCSAR